MIRATSDLKRTAAATAGVPARTAAKKSSSFTDLFRRTSAEQPRTTARTPPQPASAAAAGANSPKTATVAKEAAVQVPAGLPVAFTPAGVEDHMNQWLVGVLQQQNAFRTQLYSQALEGWRNTNARNRELGLPEVPPPPAPELAEVAPMPRGWWLEVHS